MTMPAPTTWVVLPAFNEAVGLPALLEAFGLLAHELDTSSAGAPDGGRPTTGGLRVIVVDDGSHDGTGDVARAFAGRLSVCVVVHDANQGLAAAVRTGLARACRDAAAGDAVVTMDADNTHKPEQIPAMLDALRRGAGVVIASRYAAGARQTGVPPHRVALSAGVGWLLRLRFGLPDVRDYSCGFRAYRAELLQRALVEYGGRLIETQGFVVMTELLVKLSRFRPRVAEVPLDLRYDRKAGASKMPALQTIAGYLRLACRPRPASAPRNGPAPRNGSAGSSPGGR